MTARSVIVWWLPALAAAGLLILVLGWWAHGGAKSRSSITVQLPPAREMPRPGFRFDPKG